MLSPLKIKLNEQKSLTIKWNNGKEHTIPLQFMRDESPDASNKGETILWKHYAPPPQGPDKPGKYEVDNIEVVGSYAIQIRWKDGFDHGIYSWNLLEKWGEFWEVKDNLPENFDDEHK
ncbi:MAG: DUF971 domain-containing protein [Melioribacteraceae bacterium]|nr:DUF971 domain-containing protein [Melioribacteraceae bacterium]